MIKEYKQDIHGPTDDISLFATIIKNFFTHFSNSSFEFKQNILLVTIPNLNSQ
jgi:hypothetical protein